MGSLDQADTAAGIATDAIFDAKGDIVAGTGADTAARVAVGANDTVLTADMGTGTTSGTAESTGTLVFGLAAANTFCLAKGRIVNSVTGGTAQLQWAQNTATVEDVIVRQYSTLKLWRLA